MLCIELLTRLCPDSEFPGGAADAPARTITLIPKMTSSPSSDEFLDAVARLCEEYTQGYPALLLRYHHAWALDAAGQRKAAAEAMSRIASMRPPDHGDDPLGQSVAKILRDYATIQQAILLSEEAEHRKAFELLRNDNPVCGLSHLAELHKAVRNAIETLLKEAPKHGTK